MIKFAIWVYLKEIFIKKFVKISVGLFALLVSLQVALLIILQFPKVQTALCQKAVSSVSNSIDGNISVGNVYYVFFNKLIVKDISITDKESDPFLDSLKQSFNHSDTLVAVNKLSVNIDVQQLFKGNIKLNKIVVDGGVFNLQNEKDRRSNLDRIFKLKKKTEKDTSTGKLQLLANTLRVKDFRFTMKNHSRYNEKDTNTINFSDLDVKNINIDISDVHYKADTLYACINKIEGEDKSGTAIVKLCGNARICGTEALVSDFYLQDKFSVINSQFFYMKYNSSKDLSEFTKKVRLGLNMKDSYLNFRSIGKFAPSLAHSRLAFYINGAISGPVCDLRTDNLIVTSESGDSYLDFYAKIIGLPNVDKTMAVAEIYRSSTTFKDIAAIVASINNTRVNKKLASLAPGGQFEYRGSLIGLLDDFVIDGKINSSEGDFDVDMLFRNERRYGSKFKGNVSLHNVNAGSMTGVDMLGETTADASFNLIFYRRGGFDILLDTLHVDSIRFKGYNYNNITAKGSYKDKVIDGWFLADDPNFRMSFNGMAAIRDNLLNGSEFDFKALLSYANLSALNLDLNNNISELKFYADANLLNSNGNITSGYLDISDFHYRTDKGFYNANDINLQMLNTEELHTAEFRSPFAQLNYSGPSSIDMFIRKVIDLGAGSKLDNLVSRDTTKVYEDGNYSLMMETFNTRDLFKVAFQGLYIEDSTVVNLYVDSLNNLNGDLLSGRLAIKSNYLKDIDLKIASSAHTCTSVDLFSKEIHIAGLTMDSTTVNVAAADNVVDAGFTFKNDSTENNSAHILSQLKFNPNRNIHISLLDGSDIKLEGERWNFTPSEINICDSSITVDNFNIINEEQKFSLYGNISKYNADTLNFKLDNFNVAIFNLFLNRTFDIQGNFSGTGVVSDLYRAPKVFFNIDGKDVSVYRNKVGTVKLMSKWNDWDKELNLFIKSSFDNKITLNASGFYRPEDRYLSLNASLEDLSVGYFEPFLADIISRSSGSMSGELKLAGQLDKLALTGEDCHFNKMNFKLNFTQVPYTVDGPFELNERGIFFKDLPVYDQFGSKGKMNGKLGYDYFRDLHFDTKIDFTNFQCLDTRERDNEYFYGSAFATGSVHLKGPLENIHIGIDVVSNKKTSIHIPLMNSATASKANLLTFVEPEKYVKVDHYDSLLNAAAKLEKRSTQLSVDVDAQVTSDAEIMIEIDKSVGDVIKARGNGVIDMTINPSKDIFDLFGDYHVTDGSYKFVLAGIASRDFVLQPGGTINFNGDISNTTLNLDAIYNTKSSINALIADTSSVATRRNVNCIIGMQGEMMNPQLTFKIDIPDLDPTTKMRVESAFNTQGKIQKQFMALLVTGNFIPDDQGGIANNSAMWYSNASEMLSNQISNIFHQLGIPVDLGLEYQPGEKGTTDIFDVAVSTQLFNNRVVINGNIGNDPYANSNKDVIGNIDVEIKLDNSGNVRLDLFSHAEDQYSTYNDAENSQRSGVGIVYQKEFNSFKELLKGKSKAQKAYEKQEKEKRKAAKNQDKK